MMGAVATSQEAGPALGGAFTVVGDQLRVWEANKIAYTITHAEDLLNPDNPALAATLRPDTTDRTLIVIDSTCDELYGWQLRRYFQRHRIEPHVCPVPGGETAKTLELALKIVDAFAAFGMMRRSQPVLCIGGGVVMDAAGFAASIYRRGVPYIRVPTTLMGVIDASVGVKTGISHGMGKNRLGTYYAPRQVLIDTAFLETLPVRELRSGSAEILKLALILDPELLRELEASGQAAMAAKFRDAAGGRLVRESIRLMLGQLAGNMREHELNRLVDFGHSFSPYMEMRRVGELLHGEAVALDMAICLGISLRRALVNEEFVLRALRIFRCLGLRIVDDSFSADELHGALQDVVLHRDGLQRIPLPRNGAPGLFVNDLALSDVTWALDYLCEVRG